MFNFLNSKLKKTLNFVKIKSTFDCSSWPKHILKVISIGTFCNFSAEAGVKGNCQYSFKRFSCTYFNINKNRKKCSNGIQQLGGGCPPSDFYWIFSLGRMSNVSNIHLIFEARAHIQVHLHKLLVFVRVISRERDADGGRSRLTMRSSLAKCALSLLSRRFFHRRQLLFPHWLHPDHFFPCSRGRTPDFCFSVSDGDEEVDFFFFFWGDGIN